MELEFNSIEIIVVVLSLVSNKIVSSNRVLELISRERRKFRFIPIDQDCLIPPPSIFLIAHAILRRDEINHIESRSGKKIMIN